MHRLLIIFIPVFLIGSTTWALYLRTAHTKERVHLETALTDFLPADTNPTSLPLNDLRARYYAELHTIDPIFALAGTDTEALRTALAAFDKSSAAARVPYQDSIDSEVLYPLDLIRDIADTEDKRRALLAEPTIDHARAYHQSLTKSLTAYTTALLSLEDQLMVHGTTTVMFWQGMTHTEFLQQKVSETRDAAQHRLEEEKYRAMCLSGGTQCASLSSLRANYSNIPTIEKYIPQALPHRTQEYRRSMEYYVAALHSTPLEKPFSTKPMIFLENARCTPGGGPSFGIASLTTSPVSNIPAGRFYGLSGIYLNNTHRQQEGGFLPPSPRIPDQYKYDLQLPNYYTCADYGYDSQTAFSLLTIRHTLLTNPLPATTHEALQQLSDSIENLVRYPIVRDVDAEQFVTLFEHLYATYGSRQIIEWLGAEQTSSLLSMAHLWRGRSAHFDLTLGMLDSLMQPTLYAKPDGTPTIPPQWFFPSHNDMGSLYQLVNTTISSNTPSLLGAPNTGDIPFPKSFQGGIVDYEDVRSRYPTMESLLDAIVATRKYIRENLLSQ